MARLGEMQGGAWQQRPTYALLCAGTLRQAFDIALRYHPLATPVMRIQWREDQERATWVLSNPEDMRLPDLTRGLY